MKQLALVLLTGVLLSVGVIWGLNLKDPHLLPIRASEYALFLVFALFVLGTATCIRSRAMKGILILCTLVLITAASVEEINFRHTREAIKANVSGEYSDINHRLIIGFSDKDEVKQLVANDIAGIFLTARNIEGETKQSLTSFLAELQKIRVERGLAPLIVATDQEGGRYHGCRHYWHASQRWPSHMPRENPAISTATAKARICETLASP